MARKKVAKKKAAAKKDDGMATIKLGIAVDAKGHYCVVGGNKDNYGEQPTKECLADAKDNLESNCDCNRSNYLTYEVEITVPRPKEETAVAKKLSFTAA